MAESYSSKLQLWEGWIPTLGKAATPTALGERHILAWQDRLEYADRLFAAETLHPHRRLRDMAEPFTLQWFLDIENARLGRHGRWISRLLEFNKHTGESLLGLGNGLGTDWVQYARHGAEVTACSPSADQLAFMERNFSLRGLPGVFLHSRPSAIPLESSSIDVVCIAHLLEDVAEPHDIVNEVYRLLKPGGKVLAVIPARFDVHYWRRQCLPWLSWFHPKTTVEKATFSARVLRQLFGRFVEAHVYKRHLRRFEVPHLWRWLPLPLMERIFGRLLVIKAFKPLSAAIPIQLAA